MTIKTQLNESMKDAMKSGDEVRKRTVRMALAADKQVEVDKRIELDDTAVMALLQKEIKNRPESLEEAKKANRPDLIEANEAEIKVLEAFLPKSMPEEELLTAQGKEPGAAADDSVFFASFPEVRDAFMDAELEERWKTLLSLRDEVNKALEMKRAEKFIGNSLEARLTLFLPDEYRKLAADYVSFLPMFFLVSSVQISDENLSDVHEGTVIKGLQIRVEHATGVKCQRCWNWSESVGTFGDIPEVCDKCYDVVS